jgi:hypothetical protein
LPHIVLLAQRQQGAAVGRVTRRRGERLKTLGRNAMRSNEDIVREFIGAWSRLDAVFQMENGKIKAWRDYFDMATYTRAVAG